MKTYINSPNMFIHMTSNFIKSLLENIIWNNLKGKIHIPHFKGKMYLVNRRCQHISVWYHFNGRGARSTKGLSSRTIG